VRFRRLKQDAPLDIVLPITPMLDMSFQLLAFFILTFRPSNALEGQMDMALPRAGTAKAAAPEQVDPFASSDTDLDKEAEVTVRVDSAGGGIDAINVADKAGSSEVNGKAGLKAKLDEMKRGLGGSTGVRIAASSHLKYSCLVEIMDTCLAVGFTQIGFAPPPDLGK
jgi:biopolymer transport protein ExbD